MSLRERLLKSFEAEGFDEKALSRQILSIVRGETITVEYERGQLVETKRKVTVKPQDAAKGIVLLDRLHGGTLLGDKEMSRTDPRGSELFQAFAPPKRFNIVSRVGSATSSPASLSSSQTPEADVPAPVAVEVVGSQEVALPPPEE